MGMIFKNNIRNGLVFIVLAFFITGTGAALYSFNFTMKGRVESIRKGRMITILFKKSPQYQEYYIINGKRVYGTLTIQSIITDRFGPFRYRAIARYRLSNKKYRGRVTVGSIIAIVKTKVKEKDFAAKGRAHELQYKKVIHSQRDNREMVLVPEGKFIFGSNSGESDESPEQSIYLPNYYIDRYEVSNRDYKRFCDTAMKRYPRSWKDGRYNSADAELPVLVTYYEALAYAKWAGKRLPTEQEWEKAARGPGFSGIDKKRESRIFPWGNHFEPDRCNSLEFWEKNKPVEVKTRFGRLKRGYLPVRAILHGGSPYGVMHLAGNAREWTSSWYKAYPGNNSRNSRYGTQYKVLRGGAWYSTQYRVRVVSREIGGGPGLHQDNTAGFRCIKAPGVLDRLN